MAAALCRRGYHGVGLAELLEQAGAPKGVLYHHFPGGKAELAVAAIQRVVERLATSLDRVAAAGADPVPMLRHWMAAAEQQLSRSGFEHGCPLATVALESTAEDVALRAALAEGFATLRGRLATALAAGGMAPPRAIRLAALAVAAYEGALMQARVAGSAAPMAEAAEALLALLRREVDRSPPAPPVPPGLAAPSRPQRGSR
jgi:TetR/AcrR family transcriptional repressor of lmrAB and yxaGH operons